MLEAIAKIRTVLVLLGGLAADLLAQGVIPAPYDGYVSKGLVVITAVVAVLVNVPGIAALADREPGQHAA